MVNSLPQGRDPISNPFKLPNGLLVGGNILSRGLTIPGLAVTYITRRAKDTSTDTMEQRARFFGYKQSYLDVCRVFLTHQIDDDYTRILNLEDDFWGSSGEESTAGALNKGLAAYVRLGHGHGAEAN